MLSARGFGTAPDPNPGRWIDVSTYLPSGSICVAADPNWAPSYVRTIYSTTACPGFEMYYQVLQDPAQTTEAFFVDGGFLKMIDHNDYTSQVNTVFRDVATGRKGLQWMPMDFREPYFGSVPPWAEEHWVPFCNGTSHPPADPTQGAAYVVETDTFFAFLEDRRANPDFTGKVDGKVVVLTSLTFNGYESYSYGKYWSEGQQRWVGVGLVRFTANNGQVDLKSQYLVDCYSSVPCSTCPDP